MNAATGLKGHAIHLFKIKGNDFTPTALSLRNLMEEQIKEARFGISVIVPMAVQDEERIKTTLRPSLTTTYSVTGIDLYGCQNNAAHVVTVNPLPVISIVYSNSVICTGETATISVSGATSYTFNSQNSSTIVVTPFATAQYSITASDANGCNASAVATQSVSECTGIKTIAFTESISVYPNPNNGEFTISATGDISLSVINEIGQLAANLTLNGDNNYQGKYQQPA